MPKLHRKICARDIEENPDAGEVIFAAKAVICLVVKSQIHHRYKRHVIDSMLWRITIAPYRHKRNREQQINRDAGEFLEGDKTATRYCTQAALGILQGGSTTDVRHEHVFGKEWMIVQILELGQRENCENEISGFVGRHAIACSVTQEEHNLLRGAASEGWHRYGNAEGGAIRVFDRIENRLLE